jgi:hypothetical protein
VINLARFSSGQAQEHALHSVINKGRMATMQAAVDIEEASAIDRLKKLEDVQIARPVNKFRPGNDDRQSSLREVLSYQFGCCLGALVWIAGGKGSIFCCRISGYGAQYAGTADMKDPFRTPPRESCGEHVSGSIHMDPAIILL